VLRKRLLLLIVIMAGSLNPLFLRAQIDPVKRDLIQVGYNAALEGHAPLAAYAFYYHNQPDFLRTNLTLRAAIAPVYLDSELGIRNALGPHTDVGIGLAGGGFADTYDEIDQGKYLPEQSFTGHGAELSASVYHLFNDGARVPLYGMVRTAFHYSFYTRDDNTADDFKLPENRGTVSVRTGLRWGGKEPTLFPALGLELSVWYDGQYRMENDVYGLTDVNPAGDRKVNTYSHLFWGQALLAYTMPTLKHQFYVNFTAGTSIQADRFSAYRLGSLLPFASEFPLSLPGYFYQELSAKSYALAGGNYILPLDKRRHWSLNVNASTAWVDYLDGLEQPGHWNSGVGGGILYRSNALKIMVGYGYGIAAIRSDGRGANTIGMLMQIDLERVKTDLFVPGDPNLSRGFKRIFSGFGE
jgi:hypothetical protein